ncbi:MAG: hypothetical protein AAF871_13455 [Pseudomonadota bacterium]
MNAERLIRMVMRMLMRQGMRQMAKRGGSGGQSKEAQALAKRANQAARVTRRM